MPPKTGGNGTVPKKRIQSLDTVHRRTTVNPGSRAGKPQLAAKPNQSNFSIAPLILEGVKAGKLELNDLLKHQLPDAKINDIQLNRSGTFTLYFVEVNSFNKVLNELPALLLAKGHTNAKLFVPRSIQRIKDTERVAFVKRVDEEIPEARITQALKDVGLLVSNVDRLRSKDGNKPTRTVKITFDDAANRNTFVRTGLQVDSMHFIAESATQNSKPVQCFMCLQYNHIAKYCKNKQICSRCGDDHKVEQCKVTDDKVKCHNCNGNHSAISNVCPKYQEQEKRVKKLINQYTSSSNASPSTPPAIYNTTNFPSLPQAMNPDFFNDIVKALSDKMEKIIEETTQRIIVPLQRRIEKLEKALSRTNVEKDVPSLSDSETSCEESTVVQHIRVRSQQRAGATTASAVGSVPTTTTTTTKKKKKQAELAKRARSPNTSFDQSPTIRKDLKTSNNDA